MNNTHPYHRMGIALYSIHKHHICKPNLDLNNFKGLHILSLTHFNHIHTGLKILAQGDGWLGGEAEELHYPTKPIIH